MTVSKKRKDGEQHRPGQHILQVEEGFTIYNVYENSGGEVTAISGPNN